MHILMIYRQAGHGTRVAQAHYAVNSAFLKSLSSQLINAFEHASIAWHNIFMAPSKESQPTTSKHSRELSNTITLTKRGRAGTHEHVSSVNRALFALQSLRGANARYKSKSQSYAMELVHQEPPEKTLLLVLPT